MKHLNVLITFTIAIAMNACMNSHRDAQFADTPDVESSKICQADSLNNTNCVTQVNTQDKYDQCLADHNGDVGMCDYLFHRFGGPGIGLVPLAPPGPNTWGTAAGPIHAGYGWTAANAQSQGSSDGSSVPRTEYEADKTKTTKRLHDLYEQEKLTVDRVNRIEGANENGK